MLPDVRCGWIREADDDVLPFCPRRMMMPNRNVKFTRPGDISMCETFTKPHVRRETITQSKYNP